MKKSILLSLAIICFSPFFTLNAENAAKTKIPPEVIEKQFLYEVTRHLYRWYLDEIDVEKLAENKELVFMVRAIDMKLDDGDKSQYVEIILPALKLSVKMKKADYRIDELNVNVQSNSFKIKNVDRQLKDFETPDGCVSVAFDIKQMKDYLFNTRNKGEFPSPELYERIKKAFREEFNDVLVKNVPDEQFKTERVTFIAPLSPVANVVWAYLDHGKLLVRCSSDIDLTNPDAWEHESLSFKLYDVKNQMVVALDENAGDNSFMTRDQIGRALYNCVVLGQRIVVSAADAKKDMPKSLKK